MLNEYKEYYKLTEKELRELWSNSIIIFDTSVLFHLYRYSKETSKEFLDTIESFKDRLYLPFQVGHEFHKNRLSVIEDEVKVHKDFIRKLDGINQDIESNRNPFISESLKTEFQKLKDKINIETTTRINEFEQKYENDDVLNEITKIFHDKIGANYNQEKLNQIYKEGDARYKEEIPPGYRDKKKVGNNKFGDLVIWFQIIDIASESKKPIILITDDRKEDWWLIHVGKTISPRPELLKEFKSKCESLCHFYNPFQFLKYSKEYLGANINLEAIKEVEELTNNLELGTITIVIHLKYIAHEFDFHEFISTIEKQGYKATIVGKYDDGFLVHVYLPNIPDLERRLNEKFLSKLHLFNLQLLSYSKLD